jgi:hypothetical protein
MISIALLLLSAAATAQGSGSIQEAIQATLQLPWTKILNQTQSPQACGEIISSNPPDCEKFSDELIGFDSDHPPFRRLAASQKPWSLTDLHGNSLRPPLDLTPMSRVVLLESQEGSPKKLLRVAVTSGSEIRLGYLPASALTERNPKNVSYQDEISAYLSDARLNLTLAKKLSAKKNTAPEFQKTLDRLMDQLNCVDQSKNKITPSNWKIFVSGIQSKFENHPTHKVDTLERFQKAIFAVHNPSNANGTLSDRTLVVPLSLVWFNSHPELKHYFTNVWNPAKNDVKLASGGSGEGITRSADTPDNMQYAEMFQRFLDTQAFIEKIKDPGLLNSPEYLWLKKMSAQNPKNFDRMIFIHPETWTAKPETASWQDYIPVDQSLGPIQSDPVLSTLIHEINVNSSSPGFLPDDTHGPYEESARLWNCAASTAHASIANQNAHTQAQFLGIQPYLGTITLGMSLPELAKTVGCTP